MLYRLGLRLYREFVTAANIMNVNTYDLFNRNVMTRSRYTNMGEKISVMSCSNVGSNKCLILLITTGLLDLKPDLFNKNGVVFHCDNSYTFFALIAGRLV